MITGSERLLQVVIDTGELRWMDRGLCGEVDPDLFHPAKGEPSEPARRICRTCEVMDECREYAMAHTELQGVWGGMTEYERKLARRRIERNARKDAA